MQRRMNLSFKKNIYILLPLALIICNTQWAASQTKEKTTHQIPIAAYFGIPAEETSLARYREMAATGICYAINSFPDIETTIKALDTAFGAGVKLIVFCPELKTKPQETAAKLMHYPGLGGYFVTDEPATADFPELGLWVKKINAIDAKHFCYINLFPNYASLEQLGTKTYREYVNRFIQEVPVSILSFDHYPVINDTLRDEWYENLEIFADEAKKVHKDFWAFALTVSHDPYPVPTLAQLRLQMYSNLAYGAQGIQYFTYWTPPKNPQWNFHNGPITLRAKRSEVYDRMKMVNEEIKNLSGVFMGATVVSVTHTGNVIPAGTKRLGKLPLPIKILETTGAGGVVSILKNGSASFLVIVNRDFKNAMGLTIRGDSTLNKILKDGSEISASIYEETTSVDPGDAVIFKWTTNNP
ncbi:MAG: hypothetical protein ABI687_10140 [Flavitalea sp.]